MSRSVRAILAYAIGIMTILIILFSTAMQGIQAQKPEDLSSSNVVRLQSQGDILNALATIEVALSDINSNLTNQQKDLRNQIGQLTAINAAFLGWAEDQGLIVKTSTGD